MDGNEKEAFLRSYRRVLGIIYDEIDAEVYDHCNFFKYDVTCRKGCSACCHQFISVTVSHAALVADFLYANKKAMANFRSSYEAWLKSFENSPEAAAVLRELETNTTQAAAMRHDKQELLAAYHKLDIPCPFLDSGECSIRAVRPVSCAAYFAVSPVERCLPDSPLPPLVLDVTPPEQYLKTMAGAGLRKIYSHQEPLPKLVHKILTAGLPQVVKDVELLFEMEQGKSEPGSAPKG